MQYDFVNFFLNINIYAIIDAIVFLAVVTLLAIFFIYKKNLKLLFILLFVVLLEALLIALTTLLGEQYLSIARYIMHYVVIFLLISMAVGYQSDIKNLFNRLSKHVTIFSQSGNSDDELRDATMDILSACQNMAKQDIGAIIIIDSENSVANSIIDTGTLLNAKLSTSLLESIFNTKAPLHDGAVIVRGDTVVAAGCFLTLTQKNVNKELGTRHRAAIGISEEANVLSIVVSEETGIISTVKSGEIKRYMTMDKLKDEIESAYKISRNYGDSNSMNNYQDKHRRKK